VVSRRSRGRAPRVPDRLELRAASGPRPLNPTSSPAGPRDSPEAGVSAEALAVARIHCDRYARSLGGSAAAEAIGSRIAEWGLAAFEVFTNSRFQVSPEDSPEKRVLNAPKGIEAAISNNGDDYGGHISRHSSSRVNNPSSDVSNTLSNFGQPHFQWLRTHHENDCPASRVGLSPPATQGPLTLD
jgi:hypothetical protein